MKTRDLKSLLAATAVVCRNVAIGSNLAALPLIRQPRTLAAYASENLFQLRIARRSRGIPQRDIFQVLPGDDTLDITLGDLPEPADFWGSPASYIADLVGLCMICRLRRPAVVFEIGTLYGFCAYHFALNTPVDSKIYTLDLPSTREVTPKLQVTAMDQMHIDLHEHRSSMSFDGSPVASKIECLYGDSATFDFSRYAAQVDFFFVDGSHSYEYVRSDTLNALQCCKRGSVIAWHDFGRVGLNGVSRWILELARKHTVYSIPNGSLAYMVVE